jgi:pteridine reductase
MSPRPVALVTGSGPRRIGWHVADAFAARGYALALHYRTSAAAAQASVAEFAGRGVEAIALPADVSNETDVKNLVAKALERFGRLDVLVTAASLWTRKKLEDTTAADVRAEFDANTLGTFLCCREAGLAMVKQPEGGCIVTIGDWAIERPYLDYSGYFASKGAIPTLTRTFAVELAARNPRVRVNCVMPGPVMLPAELPAAERAAAVAATLVRREGSPANVAQAVLALVDNDFVTGACLPVDGGRTVYGV